MKYWKLNNGKLQEMLGKYSHLSSNGQELVIVRPGSNRGENGIPNLDLILPFPGVPMTQEGQVFDIATGFKIPELAKGFYAGFDDSTIIIPGTKVKRHPTSSKKKQFFVTFNPDKVDYVLIGRRCDQNTDQLTRNELRELATFASLGEPKETESSGIFWDYYVLSLRTDYNYVTQRNDVLLSNAKFAAMGEKTAERRLLLREKLEKVFGALDKLAQVTLMNRKGVSLSPERTAVTDASRFDGWHYADELYHSEIWVIDEQGRVLEPDSTTAHAEFDKKYAEPNVSLDKTWEQVAESAVVVEYTRSGFAEPAKYAFLQKPAKITAAQLDRLSLIEEHIRNEVREVIGRYNLFERLAHRGPETSWTMQLHDEAVIVEALKK